MPSPDTDNRLNLRSEKIRRISGEIPPAIPRWGIAIMTFIALLLIAVVCLLPWPYGAGESILAHLLSGLQG